MEYASSTVTLFPGNVINSSGSGRTATGSDNTRSGDRLLKLGEVIKESIDGTGALRLATKTRPQRTGLTGAGLPPVDSYRPGR
ncbi:MAG: hypothetical protein CL473_00235 [Acidobacteria bacterium]|nr:hypothetical protein [Acidobacteriota bacterium]